MEIGIVGLANVGKSTLFNALLRKQQALVANYPFATIDPNIGIVPVPDPRLAKLADVIEATVNPSTSLRTSRPPIHPAVVRFVDIAGLVKGASEGAGLGNKFLANIREVDAIAHVVRAFSDENIIRDSSVDPKSDYVVVRTELELADLQTKERREASKKKVEEPLSLLADKPEIVVLNVDEAYLSTSHQLPPNLGGRVEGGNEPILISAKLEAELAELAEDERKEYLQSLGITETGLDKLIKKAFEILGLSTFLTAGEKEVRAWVIKRGMKAPQAAGVIHTDFEKHFIKADVVNFEDFVDLGGWTKCREAGKVRMEGRDYVMQPNDVVEFKIGT